MAKLSMVPNSNARLPWNSWRVSSQAVIRPIAAVRGAEMVAICSVVQKLFQAEPDQRRPNWPNDNEKAVR
jgi:hypothetical protein